MFNFQKVIYFSLMSFLTSRTRSIFVCLKEEQLKPIKRCFFHSFQKLLDTWASRNLFDKMVFQECLMPQPKTPPTTIFFSKLALSSLLREGVGTLKIRTSKGQNIKSFFWVIITSKVKKIRMSQVFSERQKSLHWKKRQKSENVRLLTFWSFLTP